MQQRVLWVQLDSDRFLCTIILQTLQTDSKTVIITPYQNIKLILDKTKKSDDVINLNDTEPVT